jgi:hypothetical protein
MVTRKKNLKNQKAPKKSKKLALKKPLKTKKAALKKKSVKKVKKASKKKNEDKKIKKAVKKKVAKKAATKDTKKTAKKAKLKKEVKKTAKKKVVKKAVKKDTKKTTKKPDVKKTAKKTAKEKVVKKAPKKVAVKKITKKIVEKPSVKKVPSKSAEKKVMKKAVKKVVKKEALEKDLKSKPSKTIKVPSAKKTVKKVKKSSVKSKEKKKDTEKSVKSLVEESKYSHEDKKTHQHEKTSLTPSFYEDPYKTPIEPPNSYLKDRIVMLVIDPKMIYTYWEIKPETFNEGKNKIGGDGSLVLRIYDVTNLDSFNGHNAHHFWDVGVNGLIGGWYLRLGSSDKSLVVDIGLKNMSGHFHALARSNYNFVPRDTMAPQGKIYWMTVNEFGEAIITEVEDFTDKDLELLRRMLGDELCRLLMEGRYKEFLGASKVREHVFSIPETLGGASDFSSRKKENQKIDLEDPKE